MTKKFLIKPTLWLFAAIFCFAAVPSFAQDQEQKEVEQIEDDSVAIAPQVEADESSAE